jgi:hypothetical protein
MAGIAVPPAILTATAESRRCFFMGTSPSLQLEPCLLLLAVFGSVRFTPKCAAGGSGRAAMLQ